MCHEPTSVGLPEGIGVGEGTVILDDFALAEGIFVVGKNPSTNSPRMMTELRNARRAHRGYQSAAGAGAEEFCGAAKMVTLRSTRIASGYCRVNVGGDVPV
jgi:anaerobic selenocysteine-containing dehydrogenase